MAKIAGYLLKQYIDRGDSWLNAVDPWIEGPFAMHRQCAWEDDGLRMINHGELEIVSKIELADADKHVCSYCNDKLSVPVYFSFQEEYKRLHEPVGWIQIISHDEMIGCTSNYKEVVDSIAVVCLDCAPEAEKGYECLSHADAAVYTCDICKKPMFLHGITPLKEARNGACCIIQLFDFCEAYAPGYYVVVIGDFLGVKRYRDKYELHELQDAKALYEALLKVSA